MELLGHRIHGSCFCQILPYCSLSKPIYKIIYNPSCSLSSVAIIIPSNFWTQCIKYFLVFSWVMSLSLRWRWTSFHEFIHSSIPFLWNVCMDFPSIFFFYGMISLLSNCLCELFLYYGRIYQLFTFWVLLGRFPSFLTPDNYVYYGADRNVKGNDVCPF